MKHSFLSLFLLVFWCSACKTATPTPFPTVTQVPLPVLVVDQEHMDTVGLAYEIPAGSGFVLDASGYDFGSAIPMAVRVLVDDGQLSYQTKWVKDARQQAVRVSDLEPLYNSASLETLVTGQKLIISIGSLTKQGSFSPIWVGMVEVK